MKATIFRKNLVYSNNSIQKLNINIFAAAGVKRSPRVHRPTKKKVESEEQDFEEFGALIPEKPKRKRSRKVSLSKDIYYKAKSQLLPLLKNLI